MPLPVYWLTWPAADVPAGDDWLAPEEAAHRDGLRLPKRRAEWRLGRYAAKQLLAACLGAAAPSPEVLSIRAAPDGAPEAFAAGHPLPYTVSISHRDGRAFCAAVPGAAAFGCDLERIEPRSDAFVADYFTAAEQTLVAAAPADRYALAANLVWSAKESALKALREGLRLDTRRVEVSLPTWPEGEGWQPLAVRYTPDGRRFDGWWRQQDGFVLCVAGRPALARPTRTGPGA
jgi:4'-phosphopantetheinyl transferase